MHDGDAFGMNGDGDGEVMTIRWFSHHKKFSSAQEARVNWNRVEKAERSLKELCWKGELLWQIP